MDHPGNSQGANQTGEGKHTLYAERFLHPLGLWYHATIVVDGKTMRHYVGGQTAIGTQWRRVPEGKPSAGQSPMTVMLAKSISALGLRRLKAQTDQLVTLKRTQIVRNGTIRPK